ncbi:MAG: ATP-grasp domain-containing protein [Alphaproteobacteria bacterium]
MARLLLLIPTTSYRVGDFLAAAGRLDVDVVVGSDQPPVLEQYAAGRTAAVDFADLRAGTGQITAFADDYPLSAILGVDDGTTVLAAMASEALGLAHNSVDSVVATRDKYRFRAALANAGPPAPRFQQFALDHDVAEAARAAPFPCVLKPVALAASRGVIRADDEAEFVAAFERITRILGEPDVAAVGAAAQRILVESFIPGREVALEGLLDDGVLHVLALFDKPDPLDGPFFEETIFVTPSRLPEAVRDDIVATARQAVAALGLRHGPIHAEFRVNGDGVWPLEVAARSIGGLCARVLTFGAGVSLEDLILRHALGLSLDCLERDSRPAGVMMIPTPRAGILRGVEGLEAARATPGVDDVTISIPLGQLVTPPPEGTRYLGFIFARGDSPENAEAALRQAHDRLDIVIGQ